MAEFGARRSTWHLLSRSKVGRAERGHSSRSRAQRTLLRRGADSALHQHGKLDLPNANSKAPLDRQVSPPALRCSPMHHNGTHPPDFRSKTRYDPEPNLAAV